MSPHGRASPATPLAVTLQDFRRTYEAPGMAEYRLARLHHAHGHKETAARLLVAALNLDPRLCLPILEDDALAALRQHTAVHHALEAALRQGGYL